MDVRDHLEQDLDKNSAAGSGVILCDMDRVKHSPTDGIRLEQVGEEFGHIAQLAGFQTMNECVLLPEAFLIQSLPTLVVAAVSLSQESIVPATFCSVFKLPLTEVSSAIRQSKKKFWPCRIRQSLCGQQCMLRNDLQLSWPIIILSLITRLTCDGWLDEAMGMKLEKQMRHC